MKFTNHHISDLVVRLSNAVNRQHKTVFFANVKVIYSVLELLLDQGYIQGFVVVDNVIHVNLKYVKGVSVIDQLNVISKPSNRVYKSVKNIPVFYNGLGITVLSTSKGIVTDTQARELNVGGEILCQVF